MTCFAVLVALVAACDGSSQPSPSFTALPSATIAAPSPTPTASVPTGTETGIASIDNVIRAVLSGDEAGLTSLFRFTETACTNFLGMGGPPTCLNQPGKPSEGTLVKAFPVSSCEAEWRTDLAPVADSLLTRQPQLYGVVQLNLTAPIWGLPYYPQPEYGVLLQVANQQTNEGAEGVLLGVEDDGSVTYVDYVCIGPPSVFLTTNVSAAYGNNVQLILRGPAYP